MEPTDLWQGARVRLNLVRARGGALPCLRSALSATGTEMLAVGKFRQVGGGAAMATVDQSSIRGLDTA